MKRLTYPAKVLVFILKDGEVLMEWLGMVYGGQDTLAIRIVVGKHNRWVY